MRAQSSGKAACEHAFGRVPRARSAASTRGRNSRQPTGGTKNPNVVKLFDYGATADGVPYIVLEALIGETLHEYIARRGPTSVEDALPLIQQLAWALDAVHRAGLIHGDVKPNNVFLCGPLDHPDCVKLIDFGFAQSSNGDCLSDGDTVAGTLEYMAPEQILSDPIDARADIYSFGIVLFRWLTAELPFDNVPMLGMLGHHLASRAPPPSWLIDELHPGLDKLILAAMRKNPDNRYASMTALLADLDCVISGRDDVRGVPMYYQPDEYCPSSEQGKRAYKILNRGGRSAPPPAAGASERPASVPAEL